MRQLWPEYPPKSPIWPTSDLNIYLLHIVRGNDGTLWAISQRQDETASHPSNAIVPECLDKSGQPAYILSARLGTIFAPQIYPVIVPQIPPEGHIIDVLIILGAKSSILWRRDEVFVPVCLTDKLLELLAFPVSLEAFLIGKPASDQRNSAEK